MFQLSPEEGRVAYEKVLVNLKHGVLDQDVKVSSREIVLVGVDNWFWGAEERHGHWEILVRGKEKVCCEERKNKRKGLNRTLTSQRESEIKIGSGLCESDGQFSPLRFPSS